MQWAIHHFGKAGTLHNHTVVILGTFYTVDINPILHGWGGSVWPPPPAVFWLWLFGQCFKWTDFSWLCSFQHSTGPSKAIFRIFFQIFGKFRLEGTWSPKILTQNLKKSKKSNFSNWNHTFSSWIWILHDLSFLLRYIAFLYLKIENFWFFASEIFYRWPLPLRRPLSAKLRNWEGCIWCL